MPWTVFDDDRGILIRTLDDEAASDAGRAVERSASRRSGLAEAASREAAHGRAVRLLIVCADCGEPMAGILEDASMVTNVADSFTEDAIRLASHGWLSRFSSTMGASGDITLPTMPIQCAPCSTTLVVDGALLHEVWSLDSSARVVALSSRRDL